MEERFLIFKIDYVVSRSYCNNILLVQLGNNQLIPDIAQKKYENYTFVGISKDYETTMGKLMELLEHKEKPIVILDSFEFFPGSDEITDPREPLSTVLYFKIYSIYGEKDKNLDKILYNLEAINLGLVKDIELYRDIYNNPEKDWTENILCNCHNS